MLAVERGSKGSVETASRLVLHDVVKSPSIITDDGPGVKGSGSTSPLSLVLRVFFDIVGMSASVSPALRLLRRGGGGSLGLRSYKRALREAVAS